MKGGLASRLLVAAWGIPLVVGLTWLGGWWTTVLIAGIALIGQYEYYRMQIKLGRTPLVEVGLFAGVALIVMWQVGGMEAIGWSLAGLTLVLSLAVLLTNRKHADTLATLGGVVYPSLLIGSFLLIRGYSEGGLDGRLLAMALWGSLWICDTGAYFGGRLTGKHPLMPAVSPKKTVEGFLWGAFGAVLLCTFLWRFDFVPWDTALVLAIAAGIIGQLGDLVESAMKREADVKDSGVFLPGHGGALDRFDSLLAAAPVLAMYLTVRPYLLKLL
jgi:phosphatidate cytidylyltransferase